MLHGVFVGFFIGSALMSMFLYWRDRRQFSLIWTLVALLLLGLFLAYIPVKS